jgi:hypothetical protein
VKEQRVPPREIELDRRIEIRFVPVRRKQLKTA